MAMIEIRQLSKFYGSQRGIENVELSIDAGEIFGFIGPIGSCFAGIMAATIY